MEAPLVCTIHGANLIIHIMSLYPFGPLAIPRPSSRTRTQRLGYSPKNTRHLSSSTAKQQSPHENNENAFKAFNGAKHPHAELRIYTCIGSLMCNCTLPFVFWELILASILKAFKHDFLQCFPPLVLRGAP